MRTADQQTRTAEWRSLAGLLCQILLAHFSTLPDGAAQEGARAALAAIQAHADGQLISRYERCSGRSQSSFGCLQLLWVSGS